MIDFFHENQGNIGLTKNASCLVICFHRQRFEGTFLRTKRGERVARNLEEFNTIGWCLLEGAQLVPNSTKSNLAFCRFGIDAQ